MKAVLCVRDDKMRSKEKKLLVPSGVSEKSLLVVDYQGLFTIRNMVISVFKPNHTSESIPEILGQFRKFILKIL